MENLILNDKPAYKIKVEFIRETKDAYFMDCEGDPIWFHKKNVRFNPADNTMLVEDWLYKKIFE